MKSNNKNLYLKEYKIGDIVEVWKYAKEPQNEHNNKLESISMIIAKRKRETISIKEYNKLNKEEKEKLSNILEYEYLVGTDNFDKNYLSWKSNYQLVLIDKS